MIAVWAVGVPASNFCRSNEWPGYTSQHITPPFLIQAEYPTTSRLFAEHLNRSGASLDITPDQFERYGLPSFSAISESQAQSIKWCEKTALDHHNQYASPFWLET